MSETNCFSERSFLVLKWIDNRLRSSLRQEKLDALEILFIENAITANSANINFEEVIDAFAKIVNIL